MIAALSILLSYQLVGEIVVRFFSIPLPGPVLGMLMLFTTLLVLKQTARYFPSGEKEADFASTNSLSRLDSGPGVDNFLTNI